jgi:hypothetical protein
VRPARSWLVVSALGVGIALAQHVVAAPADWKKEFEEVCAKTQDAMALPVEELKGLVSRCDRLKPQIEKLDETQRKVYSRRLQVCRDLYQFVVESREKG